jgi:hypothetical protein
MDLPGAASLAAASLEDAIVHADAAAVRGCARHYEEVSEM